MRVAIFDRVEPPVPAELPLRLTETCSRRSAMALLIFTIPAVFAVGVACLMLILEALVAPGPRAIIAQHPALGLEILTASPLGPICLDLPLKRLVDRLVATRTILIDETTVTVTESGHFREQTWSAPRSAFTGLAHHVRASVSGTRHELILVHPEREKSLLLSLAPRMSQGDVDRVAALLSCARNSAERALSVGGRLPRLCCRHGEMPPMHEHIHVQKFDFILAHPLTEMPFTWIIELKGQQRPRGCQQTFVCLSFPGGSRNE